MRRLALLSFAFSAAVFLACYLPLERQLVFLGCGFAALFVIVRLAVPMNRRLRCRLSYLTFGLMLGFFWTAAYGQVFWLPAAELDGKTVELQATVAEWPVEADYGYSVLVRADTDKWITLSTLLYVDGQGKDLRPGDRISIIARCSLANRSGSGEEITYYTAKGIFLTAKGYGRLSVERPDKVGIRDWPALWAGALEESIRGMFSPETADLVQALVTGNRDGLSDTFTTSLQRTGLSHTVAVSGMHLSFLAGLFSVLLAGGRRLRAVVLVPAVIAFALAAGATPSVMRAAVMILLLELAPLLDRERDAATSLGFALMLLLMANPYCAAHIGLQLSFAAVAGILLWGDRMQGILLARLPWGGAKRWSVLWLLRQGLKLPCATVCATLSASLLTTPLVALYFRSVSLIAPLSNLLTLWAVGLLFGFGLIMGTVGVFFPIWPWLLLPGEWLARYLNGCIGLLSRMPFAALTSDVVYYRGWLILLYLILLVQLALPGKKRWVIPCCCGMSALCLAVALGRLTFWSGEGSVTVLDVGQGQCVLVRSGDFLCLVDCGGPEEGTAGDTAADYLANFGIDRVDLLVLTHFHSDHANGVAQLLRRVEVGEVAVPGVEEPGAQGEEIYSLAQERSIPLRVIRSQTQYDLNSGGRITLYPPLGQGESNEEGLTCLVSSGEFDALITGDMGQDVEQILLTRSQLPQVEVLVAGHHGSAGATSQALLDQVQPLFALISVGENNTYGHPAQETLERLAGCGAMIYRTDLYGSVTIRWDEETKT